MGTQYFCKNELRRTVVRDARDSGGNPILNGIDYLEVDASDQKILIVHFIHPLPGEPNGFPASPLLTRQNISVEGGVRVTNIHVQSITAAANELTVNVNQAGDFSTYRLRLTASIASETPPPGFDPQLSEVEFSFKVDCPSDFDCQPEEDCPPETLPEPSLDYLAKDYASFRRLMLDRLATILPEWQERNPADVGVAIVETLAYAADQLSYYQDAVATEAYLGTARRRVSVRRHARLLDYPMHDGVNARLWVQVQVNQDNVLLPARTQLLTRVPDLENAPRPRLRASTKPPSTKNPKYSKHFTPCSFSRVITRSISIPGATSTAVCLKVRRAPLWLAIILPYLQAMFWSSRRRAARSAGWQPMPTRLTARQSA